MFIRLGTNNFENFKIIARPEISFVSSSAGLTGSIQIQKSENIKSANINVELERKAILNGSNADLSDYLTAVSESTAPVQETFSIKRRTPEFEQDTCRIAVNGIFKQLYPFYGLSPGFTNYQTINFITSSLNQDSVILYKNINNCYSISSSFSIDFWINPRYSFTTPGTIFHISSSIALSLHTGSNETYSLGLQLNNDSLVSPNLRPSGSYSFYSNEALKKNNWHHVLVKWDKNKNDATGSFIIDGNEEGKFYVPAQTIQLALFDTLFIGNFYEGGSTAGFWTEPKVIPSCELNSPLNAEIHEFRIWNKSISKSFNTSSIEINSEGLVGYIPVHIHENGCQRDSLITPYVSSNRIETTPTNLSMSFGVGGHEINIENFLKDFKNENFPYCLNLSASANTSLTGSNILVDDILEATSSFVKRNLTVLPNDNGLFVPNFKIFMTGTNEKQKSIFGGEDLSFYNIRNYITSSLLQKIDKNIIDKWIGSTPTEPGTRTGLPLAMYEATRDDWCPAVTLFDVSNNFFGESIHKESIEIIDRNFYNQNFQISLKDDGNGSLYRADAATKLAEWAKVGTCFYNEGFFLITSPLLHKIGKQQFEIGFKGENSIAVFQASVLADTGLVNSSSNQTWSSDLRYSENSLPGCVMITGINFYDENYNVIMKSRFAQPILKSTEDKILFRVNLDY